MSGQDTTPCTRILLSFSSGYTDLAHRVERDLSAANIHVRYDKWEGGGGIPTRQCVANGLDDVAFVIPLLTPSDAATTWVGEEWGHVIYDKARKLNIPVLPIWAAGDREAIPSFLCDVSYADFCKQDYEPEFRRLVETIRNHSCDTEIKGNRSVWRRHRFCFAGRVNPCSSPATV
jgi:hypothetical protein